MLHTNHELYMTRCLQLAEQGLGNVAPNPMVGSVIVRDGKIIGEGFHQEFGKAHAEVNAIASVPDQEMLKTSTLYVNLEPCTHFGKTPPCADLIIQKRIPRVVIGCEDPFDKVDGKGIQRLRENGVEVISGILSDECKYLNRRFFTFHQKKRPYIILKWAQTQDGFIDRKRVAGEKGIHWITGPETKRLVHLWRSQEQAILVGKNTIANDNPSLTVREVAGKNPLRLVINRDADLERSYHIFDENASTILYNVEKDETWNDHFSYRKIPFDKNVLTHLLDDLFERNIQSVIVEGGAITLQGFINAGLWDEARVATGKTEFGNGIEIPVLSTNEIIGDWMSGEDHVRIFRRI